MDPSDIEQQTPPERSNSRRAVEEVAICSIGNFIGSATVPWRCTVCEALIFPGEVHRHDGPIDRRS